MKRVTRHVTELLPGDVIKFYKLRDSRDQRPACATVVSVSKGKLSTYDTKREIIIQTIEAGPLSFFYAVETKQPNDEFTLLVNIDNCKDVR